VLSDGAAQQERPRENAISIQPIGIDPRLPTVAGRRNDLWIETSTGPCRNGHIEHKCRISLL
jgi:hypothetical protein